MKTIKFKSTKKLTTKEIQAEITELESIDYSPLYSKDLPYHSFGYIHTFRLLADGLHLNILKQFMGGLLAGIWISFAYTAIAYSTYAIDNVSVVKLLTGFIFIGSMVIILFLGGGFLTAYLWFSRAIFKRIEKWEFFLKACGSVYLGNILGIGLFVTILYLANGYDSTNNLLLTKIYQNFGLNKMGSIGVHLKNHTSISVNDILKTIGTITASAILCGILICVAIQGSKATKGDAVAAMIMISCIVVFFGIGGYQHCVANWYSGWIMILLTIDSNQELFQITFNNNSSWWYILVNIIPALIGNFFGGLIIGTIMGWFNNDYDRLLLQSSRLKFLQSILKSRLSTND
ncbi:formate/nitrite transporter family protein [Mesoplasma seiffertii]|uniref:formate/nitrite transporter family protein n=1 Tax=Mesoplasma seiffertii TaxID=28224 RepID=UPI0004786FC5|nr:formate/nitrite transporter family protein [Mesoplasma seiffertii]